MYPKGLKLSSPAAPARCVPQPLPQRKCWVSLNPQAPQRREQKKSPEPLGVLGAEGLLRAALHSARVEITPAF
jgi:hypothetical protein